MAERVKRASTAAPPSARVITGSTALLMFEAYRAAFSLLDDGRSLAISTVILLIVAAVAVLELRLFRAEEGV